MFTAVKQVRRKIELGSHKLPAPDGHAIFDTHHIPHKVSLRKPNFCRRSRNVFHLLGKSGSPPVVYRVSPKPSKFGDEEHPRAK